MAHSEEHISELRKALAHLHDPAYLENHPLVGCVRSVSQAPTLSQGRLLSRILRLSIEALDPGPGIAPNAPEARPYHVLRSRYIARQGILSIAEQLGIGERQFYRELRRGLEALAHILDESENGAAHGASPSIEMLHSPVARVCAEVDRLTNAGQQIVDVVQLVAQAIQSAQPLARDWGTQIYWMPEATSLYVAVNRVMLRQVVLNLLSHVIRFHRDSGPVVRLSHSGPDALIGISCHCEGAPDSLHPGQPYAIAAELLDSLDLAWTREGAESGAMRIAIRVPLAEQHTILIVDDNVGLIRLFERYLNGYPCLVYGASNAEEALSILEDLCPDVVILDIMMPKRDGWEVLQALRQSEAGARARVVVCSIINDPHLAEALGADGFLHKPVDRTSLLQALDELVSPAV
jgi:CheY-like chemotaxis protein